MIVRILTILYDRPKLRKTQDHTARRTHQAIRGKLQQGEVAVSPRWHGTGTQETRPFGFVERARDDRKADGECLWEVGSQDARCLPPLSCVSHSSWTSESCQRYMANIVRLWPPLLPHRTLAPRSDAYKRSLSTTLGNIRFTISHDENLPFADDLAPPSKTFTRSYACVNFHRSQPSRHPFYISISIICRGQVEKVIASHWRTEDRVRRPRREGAAHHATVVGNVVAINSFCPI